jgi:hypothetical protein
MAGLLVNLIIQLVAGAIGGNAVAQPPKMLISERLRIPLSVARVDNC